MDSLLKEESAEEILKKQLNERLKFASGSNEYGYVKVLFMYWEITGNESTGFRDEGRDLGKLFEEYFNFSVEECCIPINDSALFLQKRILEEILLTPQIAENNPAPSLLILHYGGHGDFDENGSILATIARPHKNEPLVHRSKIQSVLEDAQADVLLLLDCCFSAHAGRARKRSSRIEVLTASSKKELTPLPGETSFTFAIIQLLKKAVRGDGHATVEGLHAQLMKRETGLLTTPVKITLREGFPNRSIKLAPLGDLSFSLSGPELEGPYPRLLVRTTELSEANVEELISWLRSDIPENVSIEVESIVKTTRLIRGFIQNIPQKTSPLARGLTADNLDAILGTWTTISGLISNYKAKRDNIQKTNKLFGKLQLHAQNLVQQLDLQNSEIVDTVEQVILQSTEVLDEEKLGKAINDPTAAAFGIADQLRLCQMIQFSSDRNSEALRDRSDALESIGPSIWKEHKVYGHYLDTLCLPEVEARVALLAELLNASKSPAFRSLKCSKWYHDVVREEYTLEFEVPPEYKSAQDSYISSPLKKIIKETTGPRRPTLGQRLQMAFLIAKAVRQWHSVGWVHQGISGYTVIFFKGSESVLDYSRPFLQGFDFARPNISPSLGRYVEDVDHDVYRHPERQGPTRRGHKKMHDIYSLAVVLLEIGLWEDVSVTAAGGKNKKPLAVDRMKLNLQTAAADRLAHYAGREYQEAVLACLGSDFGVRKDDEEGSDLLSSFQRKVLDKLGHGIALQ